MSAPDFWLLVSLAALLLLWASTVVWLLGRERGRARRRGGYIKPPVSLVRSPATASTTGVTLILAGGSSSSPPPGAALADRGIPPTPRPGSSGTAHGSYTAATADLGGSGLPLQDAALNDYSSTGCYRSGWAAYNPAWTAEMAEANAAAISGMIEASRSPVGELAVTGSALSGVSDGRGDDRQRRCVPVPGDLVSLVWPDGTTRWYQDGAA